MFERPELRALLDASNSQLRAMIFLGINCGFGNQDCGVLPLSALDLTNRWIHFPRPKTAVDRRCPLWPETVDALRAALAIRPEPKDEAHAKLVFITKYGKPWAKGTPDSPVSKETTKLLRSLGIHRDGVGFYSLRHTFETIAGETRDQVAVDHIMGHARDDMASVYRERISDERLIAVTSYVHDWLFPPAEAKQPSPGPARPKGGKPRRDSRRKSEGERNTAAPRRCSDSPGDFLPRRGVPVTPASMPAPSCEQQKRPTAVSITVGLESSEELDQVGVLVFSPAMDSGWCYH